MKLISRFDYLSTKPSFYINGETSYKTTLGGMISFMFTLCIISGLCYFLNLLISKEGFTVEISEEYYPDSFADWTNIDLSILLLDKLGMPYRDQDRLFGVSSMWWKYEMDNSAKENLERNLKTVNVKMEKCNVTNLSENSLLRNSKTLNISKCVASDQKFNITKMFGVQNSSMMMFWVHRCMNSSTKNDCFPPEKIEQDLMNANAVIQFRNYYLDHKRTENIGMPYLYNDIPIVSSTNYRRVKYTLRETEYLVDTGLILPNIERYNYITYNNLRESIDFRKDPVIPGAVLGISFDMHILRQKIKKNYYKFQNMLADLGGLYKAILTIITFFNGYFSDRFYFNDIIESNLDSMSQKNLTYLDEPVRKLNIPQKVSNSNMMNLEQSQNNLINQNFYKESAINKIVYSTKVDSFTPDKNKNILRMTEVKEHNLTPVNDNNFVSPRKLIYHEIIFPNWCFVSKSNSGKKLRMYNKYKKFIINQLGIIRYLENMNNFEKICLMLIGCENKQILNKCINLNFYGENQPPFSEFQQVKNKIFKDLSSDILNYFEEKDS